MKVNGTKTMLRETGRVPGGQHCPNGTSQTQPGPKRPCEWIGLPQSRELPLVRLRKAAGILWIALVAMPSLQPAAGQDSVVGSPHDLSAFGPGAVHAVEEAQVCIFCHAPHNSTGQTPLWNRFEPRTHYRIYQSSSTDARIDQPGGPSKMCLSCHDGSMAVGLIASRGEADPIAMTTVTIPPGRADLTEDLSDDHPIGFRFDRALANRDRQLKNPDLISSLLPMGRHNEVHCTTCHDPHNNELGDFLREPVLRSTLCLSCHQMHGWDRSSHAISPAIVPNRGVDPREPSRFSTVADNGCANCHQVHSADHPERLLRFRREEDNCLSCHSGGVARTNIDTELRKRSVHPVRAWEGRHDPTEDPRTMPRHVECVDCHNPHAVAADIGSTLRREAGAFAPVRVSAANRFVSGVDRGGRQREFAEFEYEICLKCHGDSVSRPRRTDIVRQIQQTNTRLEFQTDNPSFHPVFGPRRNSEVVSLRAPYRTGSVLACTDCHNSDSAGMGTAASGPHGSIYEPLLVANYSTASRVTESADAYALCYKCHDRESILGDESFPLHSVHIVRGRASCAACHDAHGISRTQGNSQSHSNLINFDLSVVQPAGGGLGGRIEFVDRGIQRGSCTLTCHGVTHVNFEYGR